MEIRTKNGVMTWARLKLYIFIVLVFAAILFIGIFKTVLNFIIGLLK